MGPSSGLDAAVSVAFSSPPQAADSMTRVSVRRSFLADLILHEPAVSDENTVSSGRSIHEVEAVDQPSEASRTHGLVLILSGESMRLSRCGPSSALNIARCCLAASKCPIAA